MIQTTNIDRHTYYIVDARTITPRKNVLPIIKHLLTKIISRNSCYFTTNN